MCARCTDTEAEPCAVHGHDVPDPDDVCFPDDFVCAGCGMDGAEALGADEVERREVGPCARRARPPRPAAAGSRVLLLPHQDNSLDGKRHPLNSRALNRVSPENAVFRCNIRCKISHCRNL